MTADLSEGQLALDWPRDGWSSELPVISSPQQRSISNKKKNSKA